MFSLHGQPCYGWLRLPSRLKMNSLRSALTAASPASRNTYPCKGKTLDMNLPNHKMP